MTKYILAIFMFIMTSCSDEPNNYMFHDFLEILEENALSQEQLAEFKSLPMETAAFNYGDYEKIFKEPLEIILQDSLAASMFESSCQIHNVSEHTYGIANLIAAMYHEKLNARKVDVEALKNIILPLEIRQRVLNQDFDEVDDKVDYCHIEGLQVIQERLNSNVEEINYIDADFLIKSSINNCENKEEYKVIYNNLLYKYLSIKPYDIIELLDLGNYDSRYTDFLFHQLENPLNTEIDVVQTLRLINEKPRTLASGKIIESMKRAKENFN